MKLFYTLLFAIALITVGFAQEVIYFEDFNSDSKPEGYILVDNDGLTVHPNVGWPGNEPWIFASGFAISTSWYTVAAASDDWMITSEIVLPSIEDPEEKKIMLVWQELAPDPNYPDNYTIYINDDPTKTDPSDFTEVIYTTNAANSDWTTEYTDITDYAGKTVRFAFVNDSFDKFLLYIDNIIVIAPSKYDLALNSIDDNTYLKPTTDEFNISVQSLGFADSDGLDIGYSIGDNEPVITNFENSSFDFLDTKQFELPVPEGLQTGMHYVKYWVTNVGGADLDQNMTNDTLIKPIFVYGPESETDRSTVLEVFTSSTCPPCAPGNEKIKDIVDGMMDPPILLKYQQDFPGDGDPYATDETIIRRDHYGIGAIPETRIDGAQRALNPNDLTEPMITNARSQGALITMSAEYVLNPEEQSIRVLGTMTPNVDLLPGTKLQVIIKELKTENNTASNGETEFDNVVKKMLGGANVIEIGGKNAGEAVEFDYTFDFKGNYRLPQDGSASNRIDLDVEHSVEDFEQLAATILVEFLEDEFFLQAYEADFSLNTDKVQLVEEFNIYPNPVVAGSEVEIDFEVMEKSPVRILITDLSGRLVMEKKLGMLEPGKHHERLDVSNIDDGVFDVSVIAGNLNGISKLLYIGK